MSDGGKILKFSSVQLYLYLQLFHQKKAGYFLTKWFIEYVLCHVHSVLSLKALFDFCTLTDCWVVAVFLVVLKFRQY